MPIHVLTTKAEVRAWSREQRAQGKRIGFVPTMGYLHDGHLSLVKSALERADVVIASVYVNPGQFGPNEDLDTYPRDPEGDRLKLEGAGCHAVWEPSTSLYHQPVEGEQGGGHETWIQCENLQKPMCGASRPVFFRGIATVVCKLFHIVDPHVAVFGKKDFQQWRIICTMVRDLDMEVEVVGMPLVREPDGLAMSSRNAYLTPEQRLEALAISRALKEAEDRVRGGERSAAALQEVAGEKIAAAGGRVDYIDLRDVQTLEAVEQVGKQEVLMAVGIWWGDKGIRLLDNIVLPVVP